jgi:hypothetical protein
VTRDDVNNNNNNIIAVTLYTLQTWSHGLLQVTIVNIRTIHKDDKGLIPLKSPQLNGYLLTCRLNSIGAYYKASTKTQIKHKYSTNTKSTKQTNQKQYGKKKAIQKSTRE